MKRNTIYIELIEPKKINSFIFFYLHFYILYFFQFKRLDSYNTVEINITQDIWSTAKTFWMLFKAWQYLTIGSCPYFHSYVRMNF